MVYAEPRAGSQDDFETVLKGYYDSNRQGNKPTIGRKRRGKKTDPNHFYATESQESSKKEGAAFLAVCLGKVHCLYLIIEIILCYLTPGDQFRSGIMNKKIDSTFIH